MVCVFEFDFVVAGEQRVCDGPFAFQEVCLLDTHTRATERIDAVIFGDFHIALDRHRDDRGGKGLAVVAHTVDIADRRRGKAFRRGEKRHDYAARRVASRLGPDVKIICEQREEADYSRASCAIVA